MIIGMGTPSSQSRIPRPIIPSKISYETQERPQAPVLDIALPQSFARGEWNKGCHNTVINGFGKDLLALPSARNTSAQGSVGT
jgi:hypothetical protein